MLYDGEWSKFDIFELIIGFDEIGIKIGIF